MILMIGGAAETEAMATKLAGLGRRTLVLTATDTPLGMGPAPGVERRAGRLDEAGMAALIKETRALALVDAAHPYAVNVHANARAAALSAGVPYYAYIRPAGEYEYEKLYRVDSHEEAADLAFSFGSPVLLGTGSRNLEPYVKKARQTGTRLVARVLDNQESLAACEAAGMASTEMIVSRGPYSVERNLEHFEEYGVGVLVTKDGGGPGGGPEKILAAKARNIPVVMINRPAREREGVFYDMDLLTQALKKALNGL